MDGELVELVDPQGKTVGTATRSLAHRDRRLLHRVVHVLVVDGDGRLLLQRRSAAKDVAPGRWDTSVGGHVVPGESVAAAAARELAEELGIAGRLEPLYTWIYRSSRESELVHTHLLRHGGPFVFPPDEVEEVRFWTVAEIGAALGGGSFSRQFEEEFARFRAGGG